MQWLTPIFIVAVVLGTAIELWLSQRQASAVAGHRGRVPPPFADSISAAEHAKAADYTLAKVRFGRIATLIDAALLLALTVGGGVAALDGLWRHTPLAEPWLGLAVIASVAVVMQLLTCRFRCGAPSSSRRASGSTAPLRHCSSPISPRDWRLPWLWAARW